MQKIDKFSLDLKQENIQKLKEIFPDVFCEDKIDFDKLKENLGEFIAKEDKYQFTWFGKKDANKLALTPTTATLRPDKNSSKNWDETENVYIEGDNLEVLKVLQRSYYKKIKMIYIDPPYNTGNDFIYKDDFSDNLQNYLKLTGQIDEEGKLLSTESEISGRKHSNWLNMIYPRLKLARNLLKDDGFIFVSIDDNEVHNLRKVMDEIFGEENFLNIFCWINNLKGRQISNKGASKTYEYILAYAKNRDNVGSFELDIEKAKKLMPSAYKGFDYKVQKDEFGEFIIKNELYNTNSAFNEETRKNLVFNIHYNFDTKEVKFSEIDEDVEYDGFVKISPKQNNDGVHKFHAWRWQKDKIKKELKNLEFIKGDRVKIFTKVRDHKTTTLKDIITDISTSKGNSDIKKLFNKKVFDYPKPVDLLKIFISQTEDDDIILDFFAGSATTAEAVMQLNEEENANRKFILVQIPEKIDNSEYENICEISKERIRRAGEKIKNTDVGFRVFKLDSSNIIEWDAFAKDLKASILESADIIKNDRNDEDLLYEILLKQGIVLNSKIKIKNIHNKKLYIVENVALFFDEIDMDIAKEIVKEDVKILFLKDNSFATSSDKANIKEFFNQMSLFDRIVTI